MLDPWHGIAVLESVGSVRISPPCARARSQWAPRFLNAHRNRVSDLAGTRRTAIAADIRNDHGAVTERELSAVVSPIRQPDNLEIG